MMMDEDDDVEMIDVDDPEVQDAISTAVEEIKPQVPTPQWYKNHHSIADRPPSPQKKTPTVIPMLVLDTNFLISHLSLLEEVRVLHEQYGHIIVIPWVVIQELDGLKENRKMSNHVDSTSDGSRKTSSIRYLARAATDWIYKHLASNTTSIVGQKLTQINDLNLTGDDAILDCCRYFQTHKGGLTVILSNDKNLCTKSLIHEVRTISYVKDMTAEQIIQVLWNEARNMTDADDGTKLAKTASNDLAKVFSTAAANLQPKTSHQLTVSKLLEKAEGTFLSNIKFCIDKHMHRSYDNDEELQYFGYTKDSINSLEDTIDLVKKFQISVFSELIPSRVVSQLKNCPPLPVVKADLLQFIDVWGGLWIYLSKGVQKTDKVQRIVEDLKTKAESVTEDN